VRRSILTSTCNPDCSSLLLLQLGRSVHEAVTGRWQDDGDGRQTMTLAREMSGGWMRDEG
jgi:hypothetical protein